MILLALFACGGSHEPARTAPDMAPPPPPPAAPVEAPPPPSSFRAGVWPGPPLLEKPSEVWSKVLPGPITEPIATDGQRVYAVAEGRVYCFDLDGKQLWSVRSLPSGAVGLSAEGPVVGTETGQVQVLDPANGVALRSMPAGGTVRGTPVELPDTIGWVTAEGATNWSVSIGKSAAGSPAADGEILYVATLEGGLVAANKGGVVWQVTLPGPAAGGPTLDATRIYVPIASAADKPGGVAAFDRSGKPLWEHHSSFQPAAALAVRDLVLVPDKDGHVYALDPATGDERWAAEGFGEFTAQPALVEGQVYAGNGDGSLYRIDEDGGVAWKVPLGAPVTGDPAFVNGRIVVGLANGRLVALGR